MKSVLYFSLLSLLFNSLLWTPQPRVQESADIENGWMDAIILEVSPFAM